MLNVSQKGSVLEVDHPASDDWVMPHADIKEAKQFGIRLRGGGTHQSKTMMLAEISAYLGYAGASSSQARSLIVEANVLDKRTVSTRLLTFRHLNALYAIETMPAITKALAALWKLDGKGRPLLALLCALARDPLLRDSCVRTRKGIRSDRAQCDALARPRQQGGSLVLPNRLHQPRCRRGR